MKTPSENAPQGLTQSQTVRLECLRLVFNPNKDAKYLIAKAIEFEQYVAVGDKLGLEVWIVDRIASESDGQGIPNAPV